MTRLEKVRWITTTGGNEGRITDGGKEGNETDNEEDRQPDRQGGI